MGEKYAERPRKEKITVSRIKSLIPSLEDVFIHRIAEEKFAGQGNVLTREEAHDVLEYCSCNA